jgi:hypothetical protein
MFLIMSAIKKKHEPIAEFFCQDVGIRLMNQDGKIADIVISYFTDKGIPIWQAPSIVDT